MKSRRSVSLLLSLACGIASVTLDRAAFAQSRPILQVEPTMNTAPIPNGIPFRDACLNTAQWPTGWDRTDLFGNAHQFVAEVSDGELVQCFNNVKGAGKKLVIAAGALKPQCPTAAVCWSHVVGNLQRFDALGGRPDFIEIDEPLTTGQQPMNYSHAVEQTAEFIRMAREAFPGVGIILQEAYPHQTSATLQAYFRDVNNGAIARTGTGIQYAQIDHDWNAGGSMSDLIAVQNSVRANGMSFGVIFWGAGSSGWYNGLMHQGELYRDWGRFGLAPDMYAVINWTGAPGTTVPEWAGPSVFANSVRDFGNTYLPFPTATHGLRSGDSLFANESRTSIDGRFTLTYQGDGNLVLYFGSSPLWSSNTWGTAPGQVAMQGDGNLVVYNASGSAIWASNTSGQPGAFLVVQSDGNLVVYSGRRAAWASNTSGY